MTPCDQISTAVIRDSDSDLFNTHAPDTTGIFTNKLCITHPPPLLTHSSPFPTIKEQREAPRDIAPYRQKSYKGEQDILFSDGL